jgi:type II secretory pathway pseudopilin PulG
MVVMILMGIMAAMVLPEMKGSYEDALLRSASRELVDGFDVAYSQAVSLNQTHRVRLDRQRSRYVLERKLSEDAQRDEFVPVRDIPGGAGNLDPRIQIQFRKTGEGAESEAGPEPLPAGAEDSRRQETPRSGNDSEGVSFYPDGTADAVEVVLQDRDGFRLGLQINPATARVHIVELGRK